MKTLEDLRSDLTRGLAAALAASAGGRLQAREAETAAREVLAGRGLPPQVESLFPGDTPAAALVCFDADRIQSWVFGSERVPVAKGASLALERLNETASAMVGKVEGLHGVVYSAGGGGILLARGGGDGDLRRIEDEVRTRLESRSHELTFTVASLPLAAADLRPSALRAPLAGDGPGGLHRFEVVDGLQGALVRLLIRVRQAKDARPREGGMTPRLEARPGSAAERCPSCGRRPPAKSPVEDDGPDTWCAWCLGLYRAHRDLSRGDAGASQRKDTPTFSDLAEASNRSRQYLAFIAIDGNAMGAIVQSLGTFLELAAFSHATTEIFGKARATVKSVLARGFLESNWDADHASLSLLSGGDEITFVLPSAAAPLVVVETLRAIETGFDAACAPGGLLHEAFSPSPDLLGQLRRCGAAAGLVLAHHHYPVRLLRLYANTLQKQAKRSKARSSVAWRLLTDSSPLVEAAASDQHEADLALDAFEDLLGDVRFAIRTEVPLAALRGIADQVRHEERSLASLSPAERDQALPPLAANFFRYQLARNESLSAWWSARPRTAANGEEDGDGVARWFEAGGARRLERLLDLLALEPDAREAVREVA